MSPERLQQIETLYNDALAIPPRERDAFLENACANDTDLRREVESLLAYEQQAEPYMDKSALRMVAESLAADGTEVLVNRTLGRYRLLSFVGRGGMGEVYCAVDTRLNRLVAVKVLPKLMADDTDRCERFEQEARAIASLNHAHICTLHDVGSEAGTHYLVFEYLTGELLSDVLSKGPMPFRDGLDCALQVAEALAHAHEHGVIHLDLKPRNIMLTRNGAKLLDFGIAELRYPDTPAEPGTSLLGTPQYMSPEHIDGRETDARSDIFAFGAVMHQIFSSTPEALDLIVARCLAKEPSERWQTISEVLSKLREIAATWHLSKKPEKP